ncbi:MAG: protein phosphatase 2C domain-containing protein, partial [Firmicutes bacterium]|nr:protein phosphatase 2C domain-containing protein [Bacillota bacterium]
ANDILHRAGKEKKTQGMGTTMTAAAVRGNNIHLVHVGDSRAYLYNRHHIEQLSEDHTLVQALLSEGQISIEEAKHHPQRHVLLRSIGQDVLVEVQERTVSWTKGDYLLLCSDGLYTLVTPQEMQEITLRAVNLKSAIDFMAQTAFNRGGYDNISLILISYE